MSTLAEDVLRQNKIGLEIVFIHMSVNECNSLAYFVETLCAL